MFNFKKIAAGIMSVAVLGSSVTAMTSSASYNGSKAASYAISHSCNHGYCPCKYNDDYVAQDNDCTNFASQCAYKGGAPMIYDFATGVAAKTSSGCVSVSANDWFYYHKSNKSKESWSSTWTTVSKNGKIFKKNGIREHFRKSSCEYSSYYGEYTYKKDKLYKNVKVGDILLLDQIGEGFDHAVVVTLIVGKDVYVSGHTRSRCNKKLSDIFKEGNKIDCFRPDDDV